MIGDSGMASALDQRLSGCDGILRNAILAMMLCAPNVFLAGQTLHCSMR
jgi:hypothetical protein